MVALTVADRTPRTQQTPGGASVGPFNFPWEFINLTDVLVYLGTSTVPLIYGVDYTVAGSAVGVGYSGGSVTLTVATTLQVTTARQTAIQRVTNFPTVGPFDTNQLNKELDAMVMEIQEVRDRTNRSLVLPATVNAAVSSALPLPAANAFLAWDPTALFLINSTVVGAGLISSAMQPVCNAATIALARTALGLGAAALEGIGQGVEDDGAGALRVKLDATTGPAAILRGAGGVRLDPSFMRGYIAGLSCAPNGVSPTTKIDVAAGVCVDDGNAVVMKSAGALTLDTGTTGAGGLDTGVLTASKPYHLWLIGQANGTVALFANRADLSGLAPTLPGAYVYKRRIWSFSTDAGPIIVKFVQRGDWCFLDSPGLAAAPDFLASITAGARQLTTFGRLPLNVRCLGVFAANPGAGNSLVFTDPGVSDVHVLGPSDTWAQPVAEVRGTSSTSSAMQCMSNTAQQIGLRIETTASCAVSLRGYMDYRGRFD